MSKIRIGWICCPGDRKKQIIDFMMPSCKLLRVYTDENSSRISQQSKVRNRPKTVRWNRGQCHGKLFCSTFSRRRAAPARRKILLYTFKLFNCGDGLYAVFLCTQEFATREGRLRKEWLRPRQSEWHRSHYDGRSGYARESQSDIVVTMTTLTARDHVPPQVSDCWASARLERILQANPDHRSQSYSPSGNAVAGCLTFQPTLWLYFKTSMREKRSSDGLWESATKTKTADVPLRKQQMCRWVNRKVVVTDVVSLKRELIVS